MNLDFNELEKGVSDGLSKQALIYGVDEGPAVMSYHQPPPPVGTPSRNPKLDKLISKYINKVPFTSGVSAAMDDLHRNSPGGVWNENATSRPPLPELPARPVPFNYLTADAGQLWNHLQHNWTPTKEKPPNSASVVSSGLSAPERLSPSAIPSQPISAPGPVPAAIVTPSTTTTPSTVLPPGLQRARKLQEQQATAEENRRQLFNIGGRSADDTMPGREVTVLGQRLIIPTSVKDYQQQARSTLGPVGNVVAKAEGAVGDAAKIVGNTVSGGIDLGHDIADRGFAKGVLHHNFPEAYNTLSKGYHRATGALDKANEGMKALGTGLLGDNALGNNLIPLGGAALLAYLMTRDRNRSGGGQGQNININVGGGGQGRTPAFFNRVGDVNSLSNAKFGALKEAGVADAVSKAIQTRAINKVLDKAEEEGKAESKPSEKEVEITSKYPQMQKMLEDKQNKAYLERLLKD